MWAMCMISGNGTYQAYNHVSGFPQYLLQQAKCLLLTFGHVDKTCIESSSVPGLLVANTEVMHKWEASYDILEFGRM